MINCKYIVCSRRCIVVTIDWASYGVDVDVDVDVATPCQLLRTNLIYFAVLSDDVSKLRSEFRVLMVITISALKTMFCPSLSPVVCTTVHVLFTLFVFACA